MPDAFSLEERIGNIIGQMRFQKPGTDGFEQSLEQLGLILARAINGAVSNTFDRSKPAGNVKNDASGHAQTSLAYRHQLAGGCGVDGEISGSFCTSHGEFKDKNLDVWVNIEAIVSGYKTSDARSIGASDDADSNKFLIHES